LLERAIEAEKGMNRFAKTFSIGRPRALLLSGRRLLLEGSETKAFKAWHRGVAHAQQLNMPHEQALLHRELGWRGNGQTQQEHQEKTRELLETLGCQLMGGTIPPPALQSAAVKN